MDLCADGCHLWMPYFLLIFPGKTEFGPEEDAHVVGDCVKVFILASF